jgi:hypothetical protein
MTKEKRESMKMKSAVLAFALLLSSPAALLPQANCVIGVQTSWTGTAFSKQVTQFNTAPFTITPTAVPAAGSGGPTVSISQSNFNGLTVDQHPNAATLIRQSENGFWEVFNGTTGQYAHDTAVKWTITVPATFVWQINITTQTASVQITTAGGSPCANGCSLAANYKFRPSAPAASLGFWNLDMSAAPLNVCGFSIAMPNPVLGTINPNAGPFGTSVTVTGSNFGPSQGASHISFGGVAASTVSAWSATSITATVPNTATTGNVIVSVGNLISNGLPFTVTTTSLPVPPVITSIQSTVAISLACGTVQPPPAQHTVGLTWTASTSSGVTAYNIYRSTSSGAGYNKIGSTTNVLSYSDVNVANGATYYYVVTAVSSGGESVFSNQAAATIP